MDEISTEISVVRKRGYPRSEAYSSSTFRYQRDEAEPTKEAKERPTKSSESRRVNSTGNLVKQVFQEE